MAVAIKSCALAREPLYLQVCELLARRIADGAWKPNTTLPNEMELAREMGVSSGTVRKALERLEADRLVVRRQGRGTFVVDQAAPEAASRFDRLRRGDGDPLVWTAKLLQQGGGEPTPSEQRMLQIGPRERVVRKRRLLERIGAALCRRGRLPRDRPAAGAGWQRRRSRRLVRDRPGATARRSSCKGPRGGAPRLGSARHRGPPRDRGRNQADAARPRHAVHRAGPHRMAQRLLPHVG